MGIIVLIQGISAVPTGQCYRDFKQNRIFLANALSFIPSTIVLLVLAKSGSGAMAFAWSRVVGQGVSYLVVFLSTPRKYWPGYKRSALSVLYMFGVPLACANFVAFILQNIDYVLIGHVLGAAMLGTYVLAFNVAGWSSTLLVGVLNSVAMPAFTRVKHDAAQLMHAMAFGLQAVVLVAAPMCTLVMALARPFVLTLYGAHWAASATPLSILSLYGLIFVVTELFANMLAALGKPKFILTVNIIWFAILVPAMIVGVHKGGISGAALAHIIVVVPLILPCYVIALKRATAVPISLLAKAALPPLAAAVLAAFVARAAASQFDRPLFQLAAGMAAGCVSYAILTAPQLIRLVGRGRAVNPLIGRFLRAYLNIYQMFGIPMGPPPRHARRSLRHARRKH
jgi:lipopolysaccharide exporter